ncbi:MAG: hypothetical protein ACR2QG_07500 [Gammaproteobacteria bacterium]
MKFFKKLAGIKEEKPQWDIKPTGQKPSPQKKAPEPVSSAPKIKEDNPFMDDEFVQTMTFESDSFDAYTEENPYENRQWIENPETEDRRMKTNQIGKDHDADSAGNSFNPYDSGTIRKGWKK